MSRNKMSDNDLAALTREGDAGAFSILVTRHHQELSIYVASICSNATDTEDICQESYRKAFLSINSFNPEYPFKVWLFSIARNTAMDHIRHNKRRRNIIDTVNYEDAEDEATTSNSQTEASPEDTMIDEQLYAHFLEVIESLPELYREPAKLRLLNSLSYEEIATSLGIPLNTIKTRIRRAKVMIEDILESR